MLCKHCGAENMDGAKFCGACGKVLEDVVSDMPKADVSQVIKKTVTKKALIGMCIAIVALLFVIVIAINKVEAGPTINLNEYLIVEIEGYDGYGTATMSIDWNTIEEDYGDKISFTKRAKQEQDFSLDMQLPIDVAREGINVKLEKAGELSNGDMIAYTWEVDEEILTYVKCKFNYTDDLYAISELENIRTFDAFADLEVMFDGVSPNGSVEISYTGTELGYSEFGCDNKSGLRNGDVITVYLTDRDMSHYIENCGMLPEELEMEYEVEGLDEYIETYTTLTEESIAKMKSQAEEAIYSYVESTTTTPDLYSISLSDFCYMGYIFETKRTEDEGEFRNCLTLFYSGIVSYTDEEWTDVKVYLPISFWEIANTGGELSYNHTKLVGNYAYPITHYFDRLVTYVRIGVVGYVNPLKITSHMKPSEPGSGVVTETMEIGDGLEKYAECALVEKLDDISGDYKDELYADAKSSIEKHLAEFERFTFDELKVEGEYLLVAKEQGSDIEKNNKYIVVYSTTLVDTSGRYEPEVMYFPIEYDGVTKLPDGEYMVTEYKDIAGHSGVVYFGIGIVMGYTDGLDMYSEIVAYYSDDYIYEVSEGLKEFGE